MNEKRLNIAMIMDGNRRWAKEKKLTSFEGHEKGANNIQKILEWCKEINVNSLTLYAFSTENFKRSEAEKDYLFKLFKKFFKDLEKKENNDIKIKFLGELNLFPKDIQELCKKIENKTINNTKYLLQFCFGYGGRLEITSALKKIAKKIKNNELNENDISENLISDHLYSNIEPDIVIRTGGAVRQSNFLMWQSAYSEWFYIKDYWPALNKIILNKIIEEFNDRQRRFGK